MTWSPRILAALAAVVVLGGGSVAFVILRARSERDARVAEMVQDVARELSAGSREVDSLRLLLRRLESTRREIPAGELDVARAGLLLALGRTQAAWDAVRPHATAPGATDQALLLGAQVLQAIHAESGDEVQGRQALALADAHATRTGSVRTRFLAWQMAYRVGDARAFAELGTEIVDAGDGLLASTVRATVVDLSDSLADRSGLGRDAIAEGVGGDAGSLWTASQLAVGRPARLRDIDALAARFDEDEVPAELAIVGAKLVLEEVGGLGEEAARGPSGEGLLRDGEERTTRLLEALPSSVEARHLAVVALLAFRRSFELDQVQQARYRGHLQWLLRNAPARDVLRRVWQRLAAEAGR